ncbi:MAG: hypothetical protein KC731_30125 [Myxococcales bacterium]|nr:hypothetical protein [Myxococcales bacterium]
MDFRLSLLGGAVEKRYRALRPDVAPLDLAALDVSRHDPAEIAAAREIWLQATLAEHHSAEAAAATARAMIGAQAPVDLAALAARFAIDELLHAELCARVAAALGEAPGSRARPQRPALSPPPGCRPLLRAAWLCVRHFCIGEAVSAPILKATAVGASHPVLQKLFELLARDEAQHAQLGWDYLDVVIDDLSADERDGILTEVAQETLAAWIASWPAPGGDPNPLGGLAPEPYRAIASRAVDDVVQSLSSYGIALRLAERGTAAAR